MRRFIAATLLTSIASGCATTQTPIADSKGVGPGKTACGSFFVYEMCMTDTLGDERVDYMYFTGKREIFMFRPGASLPADMPLHRCALSMRDDVVLHSSRLLYGEEMNLLEEMDVKRKLLVSYMASKAELDECYGGDSRLGQAAPDAASDFASDEFDWGED